VLADLIQLEQVLVNLARNAIEAMEPMKPQERRLTIRTSAPAPGTVKVAVSDTGVGLPPETGPRIFDPFFTTKTNGLGIGLSIARSIVEMHRGQLWVEPGSGPGCTFVFTLPTAPDDPTTPRSGSGMQREKAL
jgi:signal transduction histidine kinase